jgi:hypothetical protein
VSTPNPRTVVCQGPPRGDGPLATPPTPITLTHHAVSLLMHNCTRQQNHSRCCRQQVHTQAGGTQHMYTLMGPATAAHTWVWVLLHMAILAGGYQ